MDVKAHIKRHELLTSAEMTLIELTSVYEYCLKKCERQGQQYGLKLDSSELLLFRINPL